MPMLFPAYSGIPSCKTKSLQNEIPAKTKSLYAAKPHPDCDRGSKPCADHWSRLRAIAVMAVTPVRIVGS